QTGLKDLDMITGSIKSQIDQIWNAFWSGGISNPLEVIEQITYLLFLRRLDDLHTLEEKNPARLNVRRARRARLPVPSHARRGRVHLRPPHEGRAVHYSHAGAAGQGGGP